MPRHRNRPDFEPYTGPGEEINPKLNEIDDAIDRVKIAYCAYQYSFYSVIEELDHKWWNNLKKSVDEHTDRRTTAELDKAVKSVKTASAQVVKNLCAHEDQDALRWTSELFARAHEGVRKFIDPPGHTPTYGDNICFAREAVERLHPSRLREIRQRLKEALVSSIHDRPATQKELFARDQIEVLAKLLAAAADADLDSPFTQAAKAAIFGVVKSLTTDGIANAYRVPESNAGGDHGLTGLMDRLSLIHNSNELRQSSALDVQARLAPIAHKVLEEHDTHSAHSSDEEK